MNTVEFIDIMKKHGAHCEIKNEYHIITGDSFYIKEIISIPDKIVFRNIKKLVLPNLKFIEGSVKFENINYLNLGMEEIKFYQNIYFDNINSLYMRKLKNIDGYIEAQKVIYLDINGNVDINGTLYLKNSIYDGTLFDCNKLKGNMIYDIDTKSFKNIYDICSPLFIINYIEENSKIEIKYSTKIELLFLRIKSIDIQGGEIYVENLERIKIKSENNVGAKIFLNEVKNIEIQAKRFSGKIKSKGLKEKIIKTDN